MALPPNCNYQLNGHNTVDALRILYDELHEEIRLHETHCQSKTWRECWQESFLHHSNIHSVLHWTSVLVILICTVLLLAAYGLQTHRDNWLVVEALVLLVALTINIYFLAWDDQLRKTEHMLRAKHALKEIEGCMRDGLWNSSNYINIHAPLSPCVTVQWTIREGEVVNLPSGFLVEGDVILLRPGQVVPAKCRLSQLGNEQNLLEYEAGDVYNPDIERNMEKHVSPEQRVPLSSQPYIVLQTPFVANIRLILSKSHGRPVSVLNNERYQMYSVWVEMRLLPVTAVLMLFINLLRFLFLQEYVGHWVEMLLVQPVNTILPMTALVFPVMWKLLDAFGLARLLVAFRLMKTAPVTLQESFDDFASDVNRSHYSDLFLQWRDIWLEFCHILVGPAGTLPRTSNLVHALGNITSFCCVDKKGVLSWPNPTAEKVFFLRNDSRGQPNMSRDSNEHGEEDSKSEGSVDNEDNFEQDLPIEGKFEVLDLTQNPKNGYGLEFDDPSWKKYLDSLKPLGLNILLNTCNMQTTDRYTEFADHVTCASLKREAAVPVVNRSPVTFEALATLRKRCFCELSRQMGFNQKALDIFQLQQLMGMYRHIPPAACAVPHRDALFQFHKSFIKYKLPMPHVFSAVVKESTSGMLQLFSQGTADLLLDMCSDYWDGFDLCPLSEAERKDIADFYHRTSMSSYCTGFSYRPLTEVIGDEFNNAYIEVPEHSEELFPSLKTPTPVRGWDAQSLDGTLHRTKAYHGSLDSLMEAPSTASVHDVEGCFQAQCNQIFIAMITMQYQAKQDIVQLIEDLESACIRFVHFSKENELRSRVFSEKMGLEAGWNCHISLLSEKPSESTLHGQSDHPQRAGPRKRCTSEAIPHQLPVKGKKVPPERWGRRCSAPGAINRDTPQVKFENVDHDGNGHKLLRPQSDECHQHVEQPDVDGCTQHVEQPDAADDTDVSYGLKDSLLSDQDLKQLRAESISSTPAKTKPALTTTRTPGEGNSPKHPLLRDNSPIEVHSEELMNIQRGIQEEPMGGEEDEGLVEEEERLGSVESYPASSYITENTDSVTGALGLSNRAKLPKGIENIRPHIENVDNVPLLVSLFTDSTPQTSKEMLKILQEYGEVVCCFGSSANINHTGIFLQADCSLAVEPLYPQICMKEPMVSRPWDDQALTPMETSAKLHSIPCGLAFGREDRIDLIQLIALARQHCRSVRHTFLMLFMLQLSLSILQVLCGVFLLPPILAPHHLLWLLGVVLPALSLAMMDCQLDMGIVKMAQGKNWNHMPKHVISSFLVYYLIRYVPSLLLCVLCHTMTLSSLCQKIQTTRNITCSVMFGDTSFDESGVWNGWYTDYQSGLTLSQDLVAIQLALYFICASLCFIHRFHHLWHRSPLLNKVWCVAAPLILLCQIVYFAINLAVQNQESSVVFGIKDVPVTTWVLACVWPLVLIPMHELVKHREIKQSVRYQKRARLDFGTKLGMNSPF